MTQDLQKDWFSNTISTLGDRIAGARTAAGLTQQDVSKNLGVRLQTIQNWENDSAEPRANKLQMLAGMLNVSIRWLLTGEGDGVKAPVLPQSAATEIIKAMQTLADLRMRTMEVSRELDETEQTLRSLLEDAL